MSYIDNELAALLFTTKMSWGVVIAIALLLVTVPLVTLYYFAARLRAAVKRWEKVRLPLLIAFIKVVFPHTDDCPDKQPRPLNYAERSVVK